MVKKGIISEILSNAIHNDNPDLYLVGFLDLGEIKELILPEFLKLSENFQIIPANRIEYIKKNNSILYSKFKVCKT